MIRRTCTCISKIEHSNTEQWWDRSDEMPSYFIYVDNIKPNSTLFELITCIAEHYKRDFIWFLHLYDRFLTFRKFVQKLQPLRFDPFRMFLYIALKTFSEKPLKES